MNQPFDMSAAMTGGAPTILRLFLEADNPNYHAQNAEPVIKCWLDGFTVTANAACKVELGLTNTGKSSFTPAFATHATFGAAGGIVREFRYDRPLLPLDAASINKLALRVTPAATGTVAVTGDVDLSGV